MVGRMKAPTILVVEDEALVGMELEEGLTHLGYQVPEVVTKGDEVLAAVERVRPDLILMDIRISGAIDGVEAAAGVRRISDVPLVFLTAYNDPQTLARAAEVRPDGFLIKPFGDRELAAVVASLLARRQVFLPKP
jgi:CheY-like chemotaxis protein